jgi:hypothetical protein
MHLPMSTPLFDVPVRLVRHLDLDLTFADIKKEDEHKRIVDIHSFRYTFATHLCKAGVPLRTAQAAMRHSDPKLTANVYTDPALLDVAGAIESLPIWSLAPNADEGSNVAGSGDTDETQHVPQHVLDEGNPGQNPATICNTDMQNEHSGEQEGNAENPSNYRDFQRVATHDAGKKEWRPQGDSNPCRRRERAVS